MMCKQTLVYPKRMARRYATTYTLNERLITISTDDWRMIDWRLAIGDSKLSISVLLPVKEFKVLFSVLQLKEFFLFQQIWMAGLGLNSMSDEMDPASPTPCVVDDCSPETTTTTTTSTSSNSTTVSTSHKEYISLFLLLSLNNIVVENNLGQSIGKATLNISNTALRVAFPGKKASSKKVIHKHTHTVFDRLD
jgi:hypothetical protein